MARSLAIKVAFAAVLVTLGVAVIIIVEWSLNDHRFDWNAIEALATLVAAVAAVLAVAAVGFTAEDIARRAETERVARMPYLRVDIGFQNPVAQGFTPHQADYVFDASDFDIMDSLELFEPIAPVDPMHEGEPLPLIVWVTNLQQATLGIAYDIDVEFLVAWDALNPSQAITSHMKFTYVASGQSTAFKLTDVKSDLPWLVAKVLRVSYGDVFGATRLLDAHGALTMLYDRDRGVRNVRSFQLSRK